MKQFILILFISIFQLTAFAQKQTTTISYTEKPAFEEQLNNPDLSLFPNPAKNQKVNLEMKNDLMAEVRLVNIVGKEVLKKSFELGVNSYQMQLENVPKGIYLIQVKTTENKAVVKKLLISDK